MGARQRQLRRGEIGAGLRRDRRACGAGLNEPLHLRQMTALGGERILGDDDKLLGGERPVERYLGFSETSRMVACSASSDDERFS